MSTTTPTSVTEASCPVGGGRGTTAASLARHRRRAWGKGIYTGVLLGFGSHIVVTQLAGRIMDPFAGTTLALAFLGLGVFTAAVFLRCNGGEA